MTWEEKTKLIQLSEKSETEFLEYTISKLDEFDDQALQMFLAGLTIDEVGILDNMDLHLQIYEKIKDNKVSDFRSAMRLSLYEMVIQNHQSNGRSN